MFMIVYGVLLTVLWFAAGVLTLRQPVISHVAYACAWSVVLLWTFLSTVTNIVSYVRKKKEAK